MSDAIARSLPGPAIFGSDPRIQRMRARRQALIDRAKLIKEIGKPSEAAKWDAQSSQQLAVITQAENGIATANHSNLSLL
jgi:hypothetical protein